MSQILFTADTHFGSERTRHLSQRNFFSVDSMDKELVACWNTVVYPEDIVYHLGDFGDPATVNQLQGKEIRILPGNYDTPEVLAELMLDSRVVILGVEPFLVNAPEEFELPPLKLIHEPEKADDPADFYLFGHIHKLQMVKPNGLNVGVDCHAFYPIGYETVQFYYNGITQHYDGNVFVGRLGEE